MSITWGLYYSCLETIICTLSSVSASFGLLGEILGTRGFSTRSVSRPREG